MKVGDLVKLRDYIDASVEYGLVVEVKEGFNGTFLVENSCQPQPSLCRVHWVTMDKDYDSWVSTDDLMIVEK